MLLWLFFILTAQAREVSQFIVWNVGQGEWLTLSTPQSCFHFDMGGEKVDWPAIITECGHKSNVAFFSHWDWDHVSFANLARGRLIQFCVARRPEGDPPSERKNRLFKDVISCAQNPPPLIRELDTDSNETLSSNDRSRVFEILEQIIAPGDSSRRAEMQWRFDISHRERIRILVLGHHGSRTSSSNELLGQLPNLKMTVATARFARYGHPHSEVIKRVRAHEASLLKTEDWGNIHFTF